MHTNFGLAIAGFAVGAILFGAPTFGQEEPSGEAGISQPSEIYDPAVVREFFENIEGGWLGTSWIINVCL